MLTMGYMPQPFLIPVHELQSGQRHALACELVAAVGIELAGRDVERKRDLAARLVPGTAYRLDDELERILIRREVGRETASSPTPVVRSWFFSTLLSSW